MLGDDHQSGLVGRELDVKGASEFGDHMPIVRDAGEPDNRDAVAEIGGHGACGLKRQRRLANAARPGQRYQSDGRVLEQHAQLFKLSLPSGHRLGARRNLSRSALARADSSRLEVPPLTVPQGTGESSPRSCSRTWVCSAFRAGPGSARARRPVERVFAGRRRERRLGGRAVQRDHELSGDAFARGVLGEERFKFGNQLEVAPELQVGVDLALKRHQAQPLEVTDLRLGEIFEGDICQGRAAPQLKRLSQ